MLQLSKSYKEVLDKDLDGGVFVVKKNSPLKISSKDSSTIFRFIEEGTICIPKPKPESDAQEPFTEILNVSISLSKDNIAILGHECSSREFLKAADLLYIFFSSEGDLSKCSCYIYDLKHSLGGKIKDVIRFHGQCISSMKYATTVYYSVCSESNTDDLRKVVFHLGLITEKFEENSLKEIVKNLRNIPLNPQNALEYKIKAQTRQSIKELPILESVLNKKIPFNGKMIDIDVRIMNSETHTMSLKFVDGSIA